MLNSSKIASVIAVYNDEDRIGRAIGSAARSAVADGMRHEVIVVDDHSTDDTFRRAEIAASEYSNVRVFRMPQNGGPADARNYGLTKTDAAWFTPIDSDDVVEPQRLAVLSRTALETGSRFVADNLYLTDEEYPTRVTRLLWPSKPSGPIPLMADMFIRRCYNTEIERSELGFLKPLIDRRGLESEDAPYRKGIRFGEDYELYSRLLLDEVPALLVDPLGYYLVQRPHSASRSQGAEDHKKMAEINQHLLRRPRLSGSQRKAIEGFLAFSRREWAMWQMIDGINSRNPLQAISAFSISVDASLFVIRRLAVSRFRKETAA
ncbi:MAG: glycosyltransferase family 2 protein [Pseudomonadota bacterium]